MLKASLLQIPEPGNSVLLVRTFPLVSQYYCNSETVGPREGKCWGERCSVACVSVHICNQWVVPDSCCCWQVVVKPNETLFETGDDSSSGIFIVLEGAVGVYMHDGDKLMHTNTLRPGESVGDVDILDGR